MNGWMERYFHTYMLNIQKDPKLEVVTQRCGIINIKYTKQNIMSMHFTHSNQILHQIHCIQQIIRLRVGFKHSKLVNRHVYLSIFLMLLSVSYFHS